MSKNNKLDRIGEINYNRYGSKMTIIEYNSNNDIFVKFENDYIIHTSYSRFKNGGIHSVYDKTVYGIGYLGEGKYLPSINREHTSEYKTWKDMLKRCYSERYHKKRATYEECIVCEEWHNFQNFAQWYHENYYQISNFQMGLDKDILHKGNKVYSPENCVFVPRMINNIFVKCDKSRGKYPIGVSIVNNKFRAKLRKIINGKQGEEILGSFNTPKEAFNVYKIHKEAYIKEVAEDYKDKIPERLYIAMMKYEVEITD